jgi:hypothetical protein
MTEAIKNVAQAIRDNKPTDVHPNLYKTIMSIVEYSQEPLMAAVSHLVNHKAQDTNFVGMEDSHRSLWLTNYLFKHYYNIP